jgi:hypothetical protein
VSAVPGESDVAGMSLHAPWAVGGELFCARVVEGRISVFGMITEEELPRAIERNCARAHVESVDHQRGRDARLLNLRKTGSTSERERDQHARESQIAGEHEARIPRSCRIQLRIVAISCAV